MIKLKIISTQSWWLLITSKIKNDWMFNVFFSGYLYKYLAKKCICFIFLSCVPSLIDNNNSNFGTAYIHSYIETTECTRAQQNE